MGRDAAARSAWPSPRAVKPVLEPWAAMVMRKGWPWASSALISVSLAWRLGVWVTAVAPWAASRPWMSAGVRAAPMVLEPWMRSCAGPARAHKGNRQHSKANRRGMPETCGIKMRCRLRQWRDREMTGREAEKRARSECRRRDHPDHHGIHCSGIAITMGLLARETEAVPFVELEIPLADPQLEATGQQIAGFLALVAVALLAVGARGKREWRISSCRLGWG